MKKYLILVLVLIGLSLSNSAGAVVFSSQGPNNAGTGSDVSGVGTVTWSNPGNITSVNSPFTNATLSIGERTHYLEGTNFGFSIPTGANIDGITVEIRRRGSATTIGLGVQDNVVKLIKNGTIVGNNKAVAGSIWGTTFTSRNYGGVSDLWGETWTPEDINSPNFGLAFSVLTTAILDRVATVDYIKITVTYTKTNPTLSITNSPVIYNGSAQSATVTGSVEGVVSNVLYDGSATVPIDVGTYAVTADFIPTDTASYNSLVGASAGNFDITKTDATINVSGYTGAYDGEMHSATGTATGVLGESLSGLDFGSSFKNVAGGTADWTFTDVTGNYNNANGSVEIVINPRDLNVTVTGVNKIYDGNTDATVVLGSDKISTDDVTLSYTSASFDTADSGAGKVVSVNGIIISGGTDVGNYNLVTPPTSTTANISPEAALISLSGALNVDYDGNSHTLTASTDPEGKSYIILYNGSTNDPVNAGSYSVFAQITDPNYAGQTTATLTINKIDQAILVVTGLPESATYGQSGIVAGAEGGTGEGAITFSAGESNACSVDSETGAVTITSGTGTCSITATKEGGTNYNSVTSEPVSILVSKANQTITFGELGDKTIGDPDFELGATASSGLTVTFTAGAEGPCWVVETLMVHLLSVGTCTITAHQAGDDNYNGAEDVSRSFMIAELTHTIDATAGANGTISPSGAVAVADGSDKTFTITPADGYKILGVQVDEDSVGAVTTYTFNEVTTNHSITASFEVIPSSGGNGGGGSVPPPGAVILPPSSNGGQVLGTSIQTPAPVGQVLGAEKFIFTQWMRLWLPRSEVSELQKRLTTEGFYTGPIDGKFGILTDQAVRAYQKANPPLRIDGIVGPKTRAVLNK